LALIFTHKFRSDAAGEIKCPSMVLYGGHDNTSTFDVQQRVMDRFLRMGGIEWHFFGPITTRFYRI
jgi:hypothetical protein